jgi:Tol biopolymer transport system component
LATLNHPNIASIYDLEESNGTRYLVLELVEGETLAERLQRGAMPVEDALNAAKQICEALEAAHDKGIVHRDLKPANVKITPDGRVKVLDFGLAKALEVNPTSVTLSNSPTLTMAGTNAGLIIGTAAYMSPEQARGREADQRSDVFAFGVVLYEMLTARQAFRGEDVSDVLASVMKVDPDFSLLPADLNPRLHELLRRCLAKNRIDRWRAIGDVHLELQAIAATPFVLPASIPIHDDVRPWWKRAVPVLITALVFSILAGLAVWRSRQSSPPSPVVRFSVVLPEQSTFSIGSQRSLVAMSPDGAMLAFVANAGHLYIRQLSELGTREITGVGLATGPFFSSDGQWIGFFSFADRSLKKVAVTGGAPILICKLGGAPLGVSWSGDRIVFASQQGIMRVSANGGEPEVLVPAKPGETMTSPELLDDRHVLFSITSGVDGPGRFDQAQIVVQSVPSGDRHVVVHSGSDPHYVGSGHLVYMLAGNLLAVRLDLSTFEPHGPAVPVIEGVMRTPGGGNSHLSISRNGALAYVPGAGAVPQVVLAIAERGGKIETLPLPAGSYEAPRVSPDGKQLAIGTIEGAEQIVSVFDLSLRTTLRRLTFGSNNSTPLWDHDGRYLFFRSDREGNIGIFKQLADGTGVAERLTTADPGAEGGRHVPFSLDPTGKTLLFEVRHAQGDSDIWMLPLEGDRKPKPYLVQPRFQSHAVVSPNGRWVAYMSNESEVGFPQIFVQSYPVPGSKYQITTAGGGEPAWSKDGKQLIYWYNSRLFAVDVHTDSAFSFGKPSPFPIDGVVQQIGAPRNYDILPDGRFIVVLSASATDSTQRQPPQIDVVLNWLEELKQRVPVK